MEEIMLATDIVLRAIIARNDDSVRKLIEQAQSGEILLIIPQTVLYWAVHSVKENDTIHSHRLAQLLKYSYILQDAPEYLGPAERDAWEPTSKQVEHWRTLATEED